MDVGDYFLKRTPGSYGFDVVQDNDVVVYDNNKAFFSDIRADLELATAPDHFIYFCGWWSDTYLPLGDPAAKVPTLRQTLSKLAAGLPTPAGPMTPAGPLENQFGPEVCCMVWQQKAQADLMSVILGANMMSIPIWMMPDSIFGAQVLAPINTETVRFLNFLRGTNRGILDKAHRIFGSHHQKFIVIHNQRGLVAYVGSSDFNADRLYVKGDTTATNPPATLGAPLNDVNVRIEGPGASDVLSRFVDRWSLHDEGKNWTLKGASYAQANKAAGKVWAQVTHTYGKGYPFPDAVRSAADAQIQIIRAATQYVYYEDQYLIGTYELGVELDSKLAASTTLVVIGVMAAAAIVSDLKYVTQRRSDFWLPLTSKYGNRVLLYEMLDDHHSDTGPGAYLHNKMTIADDAIATVGSVNFSNRSWYHDSELMLSIGGPGGRVSGAGQSSGDVALKVRMMRWCRHLGQSPSQIPQFQDALVRWRSLPSGSFVRPWYPFANNMNANQMSLYDALYAVADPT